MTTQTPWFERQFHFDFPLGLFPVIFSRLEGTLFRLYHILANADEEACSVAPSGWSVKQHVGHLYDLEDLWWQRYRDFLEGRTFLTTADLTNRKTDEAGHNEATLEELVNKFTIERQKLLESIYGLDKNELAVTAIHPRLQQPMRLIDSLYFVAEHDDHHIAIISTLLRKPMG
jgi:uncharacterized damage-inducible protein DinB